MNGQSKCFLQILLFVLLSGLVSVPPNSESVIGFLHTVKFNNGHCTASYQVVRVCTDGGCEWIDFDVLDYLIDLYGGPLLIT